MSADNWQPVRFLDVAPARSKDVEAEDPLEMVGVTYPSSPEIDHVTARCFVEEYALIGYGPGEIRALFSSPSYTALYALSVRYGPEFVDASIAAVFPGQGRN